MADLSSVFAKCESAAELMEEGTKFVFHSNAAPQKRLLFLNKNHTFLCWGSKGVGENSKNSLPLAGITLGVGKVGSQYLHQHNCPDEVCLILSSGSQSLELQAPDTHMRNQWAMGINYLAQQAGHAPELFVKSTRDNVVRVDKTNSKVRLLMAGAHFLTVLKTPLNPTQTPLWLWYTPGEDKLGHLCWIEGNTRPDDDEEPGATINLAEVNSMHIGKPPKDEIVKAASAKLCFWMAAGPHKLVLQAPDIPTRNEWFFALNSLLQGTDGTVLPNEPVVVEIPPAAIPPPVVEDAMWWYQSRGVEGGSVATVRTRVILSLDDEAKDPVLSWIAADDNGVAIGPQSLAHSVRVWDITDITRGKQTPELRSDVAAAAPRERCWAVIWKGPEQLELEASSVQLREQWIARLVALFRNKQTVQEPGLSFEEILARLAAGAIFTRFYYEGSDAMEETIRLWWQPHDVIALERHPGYMGMQRLADPSEDSAQDGRHSDSAPLAADKPVLLDLDTLSDIYWGKHRPVLQDSFCEALKPEICLAYMWDSQDLCLAAENVDQAHLWTMGVREVERKSGKVIKHIPLSPDVWGEHVEISDENPHREMLQFPSVRALVNGRRCLRWELGKAGNNDNSSRSHSRSRGHSRNPSGDSLTREHIRSRSGSRHRRKASGVDNDGHGDADEGVPRSNKVLVYYQPPHQGFPDDSPCGSLAWTPAHLPPKERRGASRWLRLEHVNRVSIGKEEPIWHLPPASKADSAGCISIIITLLEELHLQCRGDTVETLKRLFEWAKAFFGPPPAAATKPQPKPARRRLRKLGEFRRFFLLPRAGTEAEVEAQSAESEHDNMDLEDNTTLDTTGVRRRVLNAAATIAHEDVTLYMGYPANSKSTDPDSDGTADCLVWHPEKETGLIPLRFITDVYIGPQHRALSEVASSQDRLLSFVCAAGTWEGSGAASLHLAARTPEDTAVLVKEVRSAFAAHAMDMVELMQVSKQIWVLPSQVMPRGAFPGLLHRGPEKVDPNLKRFRILRNDDPLRPNAHNALWALSPALLEMIVQGETFRGWSTKRAVSHRKLVKLKYVPSTDKSDLGELSWRVKNDPTRRSLPLAEVTHLFRGKHSDAFNSDTKVSEGLCWSIVSPRVTLDLEAVSSEHCLAWLYALYLLLSETREVQPDRRGIAFQAALASNQLRK